MFLAVLAASAAIYTAWLVYKKNNLVPIQNEIAISKFQKIVARKYYVDEFYDAAIRKPIDWISEKSYMFIELRIIDALVNAIGNVVKWAASVFRLAQSGSVGFYMFAMTIAVLAMLFVKLF